MAVEHQLPSWMRGDRKDHRHAIRKTGFNGHRGEDMPTPITRKGYEALKAELDRLHKVERPRVIEAIAQAAPPHDIAKEAQHVA